MKRAFFFLCRAVLAAVFLVAAVPKILEPHEFAVAVFRYQLAPHELINLVAIYLPWIELTAAIGLFIPRTRRSASLILGALLAFFSIAIAINIFRGINIACGCFSVDPDAGRIGWTNIVRNLLLIAAAACSFHESRGHSGPGRIGARLPAD